MRSIDARDRMISEVDGHTHTNTYALDAVGNVLSQTVAGVTTTNTYAGTQLQTSTRAGVLSRYWYTATGALDCVTTAAATDNTPCRQLASGTGNANLIADYTYDYLDRLESTRTYNPATNALVEGADYQYDALDRVVVEDQLHPDTVNRSERFGYLGLTSLVTSEEQDPASGADVTKTYAYDAWGHRLALTRTSGSDIDWFAYGHDVHGSVSTLLDITDPADATAAAAAYGYTAYGAADDELTAGDYDPADADEADSDPSPLSGDNDPLNPYRYTAKRLDTGAGDQLDMGARRFSPDVGRFLQVDYFNGALADLALSSDPLTANRYGLAGGNPLSFIEWDGHLVYPDGGGYVAPPQESSGGGDNTSLAATTQVTASSDPLSDLGEGLLGVGDAIGSFVWGAGETLGCIAQFACVAGSAWSAGAGAVEGVGTLAGDPLGTAEGAVRNAAGVIIEAHSNLTSRDPRVRGQQVGAVFIGVFTLGLGAKVAGPTRTAAGTAASALPSTIRFTQASVGSAFRHGRFAGRPISEVVSGLRSGVISPDDLPLNVIERAGVQYSLNNRSLLALRQAGMSPSVIRDVTGDPFFEGQLSLRLAETGGPLAETFLPWIRGQ